MATLPGAWHYRVNTGIGQPNVSFLWLGEVESLMCNFYLSVAAHKIEHIRPWDTLACCWDIRQTTTFSLLNLVRLDPFSPPLCPPPFCHVRNCVINCRVPQVCSTTCFCPGVWQSCGTKGNDGFHVFVILSTNTKKDERAGSLFDCIFFRFCFCLFVFFFFVCFFKEKQLLFNRLWP